MLQTLWPSTNKHPARIDRKTVCVRQRRDRCEVGRKDHAGLSEGEEQKQQRRRCGGRKRLYAADPIEFLTSKQLEIQKFSLCLANCEVDPAPA
ncbi:hypothetical protein XCR_1397 [Xanthomonas campestris pv. raphani 756C]|nr:hypothetical protein XCR_1397 [Xanthomonas campestris pv. raphani 756C]